MYCIIGQMHIFVTDVTHAVLFCTKSQIALLVNPYFCRLKRTNQYPLPYVELSVSYDQWVFNIFLHYELHVLIECVVKNILQLNITFDSSSPRQVYVDNSLRAGLMIHMLLWPLILNWGSFASSFYNNFVTCSNSVFFLLSILLMSLCTLSEMLLVVKAYHSSGEQRAYCLQV